MKEWIGILEKDPAYAEALCGRLNEDGDFPYRAEVLKDREALLPRLKEAPPAVLLLSTACEDEEVLRADIPKPVFLTDVKGYASIRGIPALFKYRPVSELKEEILRIAAEAPASGSGTGAGIQGRCAFVGVASPSGRVQKTAFSLVLGTLLAQNANVLYVNLEPCSGFQALFEKTFERDLADVLYRYEAGEEDLCPEDFLEDFHGLKILPPAGLPEDLCHAAPDTVRDAVAAAAKRLGADIAVLDLGPDLRFTAAFFPLLEKLYVPVLQNAGQEGKQEAFRAFLARLRDGAAGPETEEVSLPPVRTFARGRVYLERLLWSELGDCARQLLGGIA
ncbi:MAG: hypothetical protein J6Z38_08590 [Lachnospiraceae bacterium]|nr:hypothetical protein [Lachnospiraceae bacterium]